MASLKGNRASTYVPGSLDESNLPRSLREEFERIATAFQSPVPMLSLDISYKAPDRLPTDRVPVVFADGTKWNPGAGAGVYAYYGGAWNKLG